MSYKLKSGYISDWLSTDDHNLEGLLREGEGRASPKRGSPEELSPLLASPDQDFWGGESLSLLSVVQNCIITTPLNDLSFLFFYVMLLYSTLCNSKCF